MRLRACILGAVSMASGCFLVHGPRSDDDGAPESRADAAVPAGIPRDEPDERDRRDDEGEDEPGLIPIASYDVYCSRLTDLLCDRLQKCCRAPNYSFSRRLCDRTVFEVGFLPHVWCGPELKPQLFDGASAALCVQLVERLTRDCSYPRNDDPVWIEARWVCELAATFRPSDGESCADGSCISAPGMASVCDWLDDPREPVCLPSEPRAALGEPCSWFPGCEYGSYCDGFGGDGTCLAPKPDGAECVEPNECASSVCMQDDALGGVDGHCNPAREIGRDDCRPFNNMGL